MCWVVQYLLHLIERTSVKRTGRKEGRIGEVWLQCSRALGGFVNDSYSDAELETSIIEPSQWISTILDK